VISSRGEEDVFVEYSELRVCTKFSWEDVENTGKTTGYSDTKHHSLRGLLALIHKEDTETNKCVSFEQY